MVTPISIVRSATDINKKIQIQKTPVYLQITLVCQDISNCVIIFIFHLVFLAYKIMFNQLINKNAIVIFVMSHIILDYIYIRYVVTILVRKIISYDMNYFTLKLHVRMLSN